MIYSDLFLSDHMNRIPQGVFLIEDQKQNGINIGAAKIRYDINRVFTYYYYKY